MRTKQRIDKKQVSMAMAKGVCQNCGTLHHTAMHTHLLPDFVFCDCQPVVIVIQHQARPPETGWQFMEEPAEIKLALTSKHSKVLRTLPAPQATETALAWSQAAVEWNHRNRIVTHIDILNLTESASYE